MVGIGSQLLPNGRAEAVDERTRIEARARDQRQKLTAYRIKKDARDALLTFSASGHKLLHSHIEPDHYVLTRLAIDSD